MIKGVHSLIQKCDFISKKVEISYNNNTIVKNAVGGCLSMILVVLFGIITLYFGLEIFIKEQPIVRSYDEFGDKSTIYLKDFPILFYSTLLDGTDVFKTFSEAIELSVESKVFPSSQTGFSLYLENLILDRCQQEFMSEDNWTKLIATYDLNLVKCINPYKKYNKDGKLVEENIFFENPYAADSSNFIQFFLKKCDEKKKPGCWKPMEKVSKFFTFVVFLDTYQDLSDRDSPIKTSFNTFTQQVSTKLYTRNYYEIKNADLISDNGMIFRDESSQSFYQYGSEKSVIDFYNDADRFMLNYTFSSPLLKRVLVRRYLKVPELFANIGGFIKAITLLAQFIVQDYSSFILFNNFSKNIVWKDKNKAKTPSRIAFSAHQKPESVQVKQSESHQNIRRAAPEASVYTYISYYFWLKHRFLTCKSSEIDTKQFKRYFDIGEIHLQRIALESRIETVEQKISA